MNKRAHRRGAYDHWFAIAHGGISPETAEWLGRVAKDLLKANYVRDATKRRLAIVNAVGLLGKIDIEGEIIRRLAALPESNADPQIVGNSPQAKTARRARLRDDIRGALALHHLSDEAVDARIGRAAPDYDGSRVPG